MWKLIIEDDEGKRTIVPLTRDDYTIGRKEGNTIRLTERNVSRDHAKVTRRASQNGSAGPAYFVEDLTSYNGVYVNGLRVGHAQELHHGDLIQVGDYRIVLQNDESADAPASMSGAEATKTIRMQSIPMLEQPERLVMLVGPTPGAEYALTQERMTIGRAEEATISINHNSVSRIHCEIHALADGRFEIVDKGSSNGVRVNNTDLRRGFIEPGDLLELGDVRLKFVGKGQIFRPGSTETSQLAVIGDRRAHTIVDERKSSVALPVTVFLLIVGLGILGAFAVMQWIKPGRATSTVDVESPDEVTLSQARKLAQNGDLEGAHQLLATLAESSAQRRTAEFSAMENKWAEAVLQGADKENDPAKKKTMLQRVLRNTSVDEATRKAVVDKLAALDHVVDPSPSPSASPTVSETPKPQRDAGRREPDPNATPTPTPTPKGFDPKDLLEDDPKKNERMKAALSAQCFGAKGCDDGTRAALRALCKKMGDRSCVDAVRQLGASARDGG